jgi:long-chain acyl-CoA synthetase
MALSIPDLLRDRVARTPDAEAMRYRDNGGWASLTWAQLQERVAKQAFGLRAKGLAKGDRVALMGGTSIDWIITDLAVLAAGGATTTIYPNSTKGEVAHIVTDSGSRMVVVETDEHAALMPDVEVLRFGAIPEADGDYDALIDELGPDDLATLIYTSGTTGTPKGVELTHNNWLTTSEAIASLGILQPTDLHFLWLPLSHAFGKVLTMAMIAAGVPTAVDGSVERIVDNLGELRPSIVAGSSRARVRRAGSPRRSSPGPTATTVPRRAGSRIAWCTASCASVWAGASGTSCRARPRSRGRSRSSSSAPASRSWRATGSPSRPRRRSSTGRA